MNQLVDSPFAKERTSALAETAGAMQSQSREVAETQTKYLMAQRFPRDPVDAMDRILNAFTRPTLAEKAEYQFARGGSDIAGPSIRAAEAIAQQWGNMEQGFRELSRGVDERGVPFSEVEAFCVDLQGRTSKRLQFIVKHWRDTRQGGYQLKDERDIYELMANQAQRRVRACILAMIPGDVVEAAMSQVEVTLKASADTSPEAMARMVEAFKPWGVTKDHIEKKIQRRIDAIQPAQVITLKRIYASLRDDMSKAEDWFEFAEGTAPVKPAPVEAAYPQEQFEKNLPTWLAAIAEGKQTVESITAKVKTKGKFTEAQVKALSAKPEATKQAQATQSSGGPAITFAHVADKMNAATDKQQLDDAGALIGEVTDLKQRSELSAIYDKRAAELGAD